MHSGRVLRPARVVVTDAPQVQAVWKEGTSLRSHFVLPGP
jgi:hypothetical protein